MCHMDAANEQTFFETIAMICTAVFLSNLVLLEKLKKTKEDINKRFYDDIGISEMK